MDKVFGRDAFERYNDGSLGNECIDVLSRPESLSWESAYWRTKYLFSYCRNICDNEMLIRYLHECFNQGLSVNSGRELYLDARKMQSSIYIEECDYNNASKCILAVLDITEDIPAEMFLDLTCSELYTDLLLVLKNPSRFFDDLHVADSDSNLKERQKSIIKTLLKKATEEISRNPKVEIDTATIKAEVLRFGLNQADEFVLFNGVVSGEVKNIIVEPIPDIHIKPKQDTDALQSSPDVNIQKRRNSEGLLEIEIFTENKDKIHKKPDITNESNTTEKTVTLEQVKTDDISRIEAMLETLMQTVSDNSKQITSLHEKMQMSQNDTASERIKLELEQGEIKNRELLSQLEAAKSQIVEDKKQLEEQEKLLKESEKQIEENNKQIAESERIITEKETEKAELVKKLSEQNSLLESKSKAEFSEEELQILQQFERIIIFDTCAIEHQPDILDYASDKDAVRISQTVVQELENHKKNRYDIEKSKMGQKSLKSLYSHKTSTSFGYEGCYTFLLPEALRIKEDDDIGTANDKEIFSLAMRYKLYAGIPILVVSDDTTMQVMAESEGISNMSSESFISAKSALNETHDEVSKEQFCSKKLKNKDYSLTQYEITLLLSYGINTVGDLLDKGDYSYIRDKKGISYAARISQVAEKIQKHYNNLFGDSSEE